MEVVLKFNSNNGLDLNVQKYKKELPLLRPVALDVEKCHTTLCKLSALEETLSKIKTGLQTWKNSLYDENVPKQWASDELEYLDLNLKKLTKLQQNLTSLQSSVTHTYKFLSSRFNRDTVVQKERKRVTKGTEKKK
jgi:two-component SAPR family response regulator